MFYKEQWLKSDVTKFHNLQSLSCVQFFCDPMACSPPGSSVHGISQARILECVAISSSRGSYQPMDQSYVSCIGRKILNHWAAQEAHHFWGLYPNIPKALPPLIVTLGIRILRCEVWGRHRHSGASRVDQNPPAMKETCFNFWAG